MSNYEYYDSPEQHFWEGPCHDPNCEYCHPQKRDDQQQSTDEATQ